jgi:hypothetical protein
MMDTAAKLFPSASEFVYFFFQNTYDDHIKQFD